MSAEFIEYNGFKIVCEVNEIHKFIQISAYTDKGIDYKVRTKRIGFLVTPYTEELINDTKRFVDNIKAIKNWREASALIHSQMVGDLHIITNTENILEYVSAKILK
jgi:hypothetical protein